MHDFGAEAPHMHSALRRLHVDEYEEMLTGLCLHPHALNIRQSSLTCTLGLDASVLASSSSARRLSGRSKDALLRRRVADAPTICMNHDRGSAIGAAVQDLW